MRNVFNINTAQYSPLACDELVPQIFSAKNELPSKKCALNELPSKRGSENELHPYSSILNDLPSTTFTDDLFCQLFGSTKFGLFTFGLSGVGSDEKHR